MGVPVGMCLWELQVQEAIHGSTNRLVYYLADRPPDTPIIDRAFADLYFVLLLLLLKHTPLMTGGKIGNTCRTF